MYAIMKYNYFNKFIIINGNKKGADFSAVSNLYILCYFC
jgi:hypothetical protein